MLCKTKQEAEYCTGMSFCFSSPSGSTAPRALRLQTSHFTSQTSVTSSVRYNNSSSCGRFGSQSGVGIERPSGRLPQDSERGEKNLERSKNGQCATPRMECQVRFSPRLAELAPPLGVRPKNCMEPHSLLMHLLPLVFFWFPPQLPRVLGLVQEDW